MQLQAKLLISEQSMSVALAGSPILLLDVRWYAKASKAAYQRTVYVYLAFVSFRVTCLQLRRDAQ